MTNRFLVAAAVAGPLAFLALAGWMGYRQIEGKAYQRASLTAGALAEHALRTLQGQEQVIRFVDVYVEGWTWGQIERSPDLHRLLRRLREENPHIASIFLLDPMGHRWTSSRAFPMPPIDGSDRDYYRTLREREQVFIGEPMQGRLQNDRFFAVARRRSAAGGEFDGLIAVSVNPSYFAEFYGTVALSGEGAALVRGDGKVLARFPDSGELPAAGFDPRTLVGFSSGPLPGTLSGPSLVDGVDSLHAYRRVGGYPVFVVFRIPRAAVTTEWLRETLPYALTALLMMGTLLAAIALARQRARRTAAEQHQQAAEEASRAKDRFLAAISHELRSPLSAIGNAAEILRRRPKEADSRFAAEVIARQIRQVRAILDDLLDTARAIYGKMHLERRTLDLLALGEQVVADWRSRALAELSIDGDPCWVDGDPARLRQLLDNLIGNAMASGARRVVIRVQTEGDWGRVDVADDGRGIPEGLLAHLFEPFVQGEQTLDRAKGGLGLGLALSQHIARLHGGAIQASSEGVGRGSLFTLRLPAAAPQPEQDIAPDAASRPRPRLILIAEDQPDVRESLAALLTAEGHRVIQAANGDEALDALRRETPDVGLFDIGLPGMDGFDLARRTRELVADRSLLLIAISGYGQKTDRRRALDAGFDVHLTKPIDFDGLSRIIERGRADETALP